MPVDAQSALVALAISAGALFFSHQPIMPSVHVADILAGIERIVTMPPCLDEAPGSCLVTAATP